MLILYLKGMNEIIGPIYYVFATDSRKEWRGNLPDFKISLAAKDIIMNNILHTKCGQNTMKLIIILQFL